MGDSKRWTVTYTKHIKQKRKVYQDGSLEHHSNKMMLYDDTDKLIDSRFMKKDEIVECGGTLTFDGYLVDIGDPQGNNGVLKDLNAQGLDKKLSERTNSSHEDKKNEFHQFGSPKSHLRLNGTKTTPRGSTLYTLQKNEAVQSHSNSPKSSTREWQVLYTTQITQKAKRYHDGILRTEFRGSHQKQVMLYDASRNLLDSRFLKKDEVVEFGETVVFGAHLVDVGDPEAGPRDCMEVPPRHGNTVAGARLVKSSSDKKGVELVNTEERLFPKEKAEEQTDSSKLMLDNIREWHAMYTTQITQKAKKYHDGFLQLTFCNYQRKQVILLSEDRTVLSKKYFNSSADVKSGSTLQLTNYLVEIGEPKNDASSGKLVGSYSSSSTDKIRFSASDSRSKPTNVSVGELQNAASDSRSKPTNVSVGELQNATSSGKHAGSSYSSLNVEEAKFRASDSRNKPTNVSVGELQNATSSGNHAGSSYSSLNVEETKFGASDSRNKPINGREKMNKPIRDVVQILSTLRKPMAPESVSPTRRPSLEQICSSQSSDSCHIGLKEPHSSISESQASDAVLDLPDERTTNSYSSSAEPQESKVVVFNLPDESTSKSCSLIAECQVSNMLVLDLPEDKLPYGTSTKHNRSMNNSQSMESHCFPSSEGSSCSKSRISKSVQDNNSNQTCPDKMETGTGRKEGSRLGSSSSSGSAPHYLYGATMLEDRPEEIENIYEYPSFDLGI